MSRRPHGSRLGRAAAALCLAALIGAGIGVPTTAHASAGIRPAAGEPPADDAAPADEDVPPPSEDVAPGDIAVPDAVDDSIDWWIPEDDGNWEDLPTDGESDPEWGFDLDTLFAAFKALIRFFQGVDLPTEDELDAIWAEWERQADEWNEEWKRDMPDPDLPNPATTSIEPVLNEGEKNVVPMVSWQDDLNLAYKGCAGGTAVYTMTVEGQVVRSGPLAESANGTYVGVAGAVAPATGEGEVTIQLTCPTGTVTGTNFDLYIDPEGTVVDQNGNLLTNARAVLLRSDDKDGPYAVVPDGSSIMSPGNRSNPSITGADGRFQWDVVAGWYVVRAYADGCTNPANAKVPFAETQPQQVPPPRFGLVIKMKCSNKAARIKNLKITKPGTLSGRAVVGATLRAVPPKAAGARVTVSWQRVNAKGSAIPIIGATGSTYKVKSADKGWSIRAVFTVSKNGFATKTVNSKSLRVA
ncbi:MAG: hypothetical protein KJS90_06745 [Acidobacteria bacterium]|nr:hypothetical protein [Acidobacteriota bacterium]